jgi:hypothetical protein
MGGILKKLVFWAILAVTLLAGGCGSNYSHGWLYPESISTVYVEMFDTRSFRRGHEYVLTDAIAKHIETDTPYKIISDRNIADSVLSGQLGSIGQRTLNYERNTGSAFESETRVFVTVSWKNLKTGQLFIDNETVEATATFSLQAGQDFEYASRVAMNRAAERVVELMQTKWEPVSDADGN